MSDHSKPIGNPPPTDIEGEQSGQDHENLTFSDIIKCCYEVDMLVQQAENRASMLRNEHGNTVPQLSDDDKQELIKLFERMSSQSQSMANSLKSYRPLPTVVPTAATHTNDLSPKVITPDPASPGDLGVESTDNSDDVDADKALADESQSNVFPTCERLPSVAAAPQDHAESGQQMSDIPVGSKVENQYAEEVLQQESADVTNQSTSSNTQGNEKLDLPKIADNCLNILGEVEQMKNDTEKWKEEYGSQAQLSETHKLNLIGQLGSMISNVQSLCVQLDNSGLCDSPLPGTDQHANADEQEVTVPVQKGVIMQDESEDQDQHVNLEQDLSAVTDQTEANVVDTSAPTTKPCMEVVLYDQQTEASAPPIAETSSDSEEEQEDTRSYEFSELPFNQQSNFVKQLLLATLPYFLSAIEDVRSGRRQPQNAHFNEAITGFLKFVKKAKNDKKTKDGFKNFKPITFIEQQYAKSRVSKKNELIYDTLGTYLSQQKYEQPIIELLYYFSEKKFLGAVPAESTMGNLMSGLEHYFFFHVVEWLKGYWRQSFEAYVKRQETVLRDLSSKDLPKRYRPSRNLEEYKLTPFFCARIMVHSKLVAVSPEMFMVQKAYALLQTTKVESRILDSDIDFLKTNWTKCEKDNIALEYALFSEILCTKDQVLQF